MIDELSSLAAPPSKRAIQDGMLDKYSYLHLDLLRLANPTASTGMKTGS